MLAGDTKHSATERRASLEALALEQLPQATCVIDDTGSVTLCNRAFRQLLEPIGAPPSLPAGIARRAQSGDTLTLELGRPVKFTTKLLYSEDTRQRQILLTQDASATMEASLTETTQQLHQADVRAAMERDRRRQLTEDIERTEAFSRMAAHDLKSPLRAIHCTLEFFLEDHGDLLDDDALEMIGRTRSAAKRLQDLIDTLLQHAQSSAVPVVKETIDLDNLLTDLTWELAPVIAAADAEVVINVSGSLEGEVWLLHQLFENLLSNSLKYRSPDRALKIRVSRPAPDLIEICDNGVGFDNDQCERIFEEFTRLADKPGTEGSGIGLATCRMICERHGWSIAAMGKPGQGALFRIHLTPAQPDHADGRATGILEPPA